MAAIFFGFVPAWRLSHVAPQQTTKDTTAIGPVRGSQRLQNSIVAVEIAATLVLLISGGLLIRSFVYLLNSPFGFDPNNVVVVRTLFNPARYPDASRRMRVQQQLIDTLGQLPGVQAVAAASHLP